jgi:hypothetical protein
LASNFTSLRFSLGGRQIISFPIAGDIVGLRRVLLRTADHSFSALTKAVVHAVEGAHIVKCMTEFPRLGAALLWSASRDEAGRGASGQCRAAQRSRAHGTDDGQPSLGKSSMAAILPTTICGLSLRSTDHWTGQRE